MLSITAGCNCLCLIFDDFSAEITDVHHFTNSTFVSYVCFEIVNFESILFCYKLQFLTCVIVYICITYTNVIGTQFAKEFWCFHVVFVFLPYLIQVWFRSVWKIMKYYRWLINSRRRKLLTVTVRLYARDIVSTGDISHIPRAWPCKTEAAFT